MVVMEQIELLHISNLFLKLYVFVCLFLYELQMYFHYDGHNGTRSSKRNRNLNLSIIS
jgi:hypothetical protein